MKMKMLGAVALTTASLGATSAMADCGEVSITEMDWASSAVVTAVATFLMEQGYGCERPESSILDSSSADIVG